MQFRTKSGTNRIRGTAYEYLRNKVFNANTFFGNQAHLPNPAFTQNQFGVNIGGPVYLPHLYDGRNRTFFFLNWEGFALRQGITYTQTVPTAAELSGNLSDLNTPIYDPLSTCGVAGGSPCAPGQSQYNRTAFANATIPSNRLNPTSVAYLKAFFPAPNLPGLRRALLTSQPPAAAEGITTKPWSIRRQFVEQATSERAVYQLAKQQSADRRIQRNLRGPLR